MGSFRTVSAGGLRPRGAQARVAIAAVVLGSLVACTKPSGGVVAPTPDAGPMMVMTAEVANRPPLRRLTNDQYANTVRDLLGVSGGLGVDFEADEESAGFVANSTLGVQTLNVDEYQSAAEEVATKAVTSGLATLAPCAPGTAEATCVDTFVRGFGKRAYRRPLAPDEVNRYQALFTVARAKGDYAYGITLIVRTMLQSPHFLYRVELGVPGAVPASDGTVPLSSYELASRLSYFLWNTMPDKDLFAVADSGKLSEPTDVAARARLMMKDPKAADTLRSFHHQWLQLQSLPDLDRSDPMFTADVRDGMGAEVTAFVDNVIRLGDGRLETLLTATYTYLPAALFPLYGLPPSKKAAKSLVPIMQNLPPEQTRAGMLTLLGVMATHAHPDQTSIVHRGKLVREQLLCTTPPPPPDDVKPILPPVDPNQSARARLEAHRTEPRCAGCHSLMDPLGTPFEMFDPLGRFRTTDGNQPIDSSGALTGTAENDGPANNPVELTQRLAKSEEVRRCVSRQWFRYAFGRLDETPDAATLAIAWDAFKTSDYKIPELLISLTQTRAFRFRLPVKNQ